MVALGCDPAGEIYKNANVNGWRCLALGGCAFLISGTTPLV
jgi:hypothetical protein